MEELNEKQLKTQEIDKPAPEIINAFESRVVRLLTMLFAVSIVFAFWLISFDEMIKAFIGILIINGWFFTILLLHLQGKILFLDDIEKIKEQNGEFPRSRGPREG